MPAPSTASYPAQTGTPPVTPRPRRTHPPVPDSGAEAAPRTAGNAAVPAVPADAAGEVIRWAVFSCLLVPVVLVVYGTSVGGAAVAALGLAAVTTGCRLLLRQSERAAAQVRAAEAESAAATAMTAAGDGRTEARGAHWGSRAREESAPGH
ncbi:hypothetical protein [Streptomyces sp. AcH 505]|uniref:hypothetical protein n=1 Tax=Streptomyces sp. AcH 505 TaxID=352211 RepID=UPI000693C561